MKKFYTLILSSLCMMTAVAAPMGRQAVNPLKAQKVGADIEAPAKVNKAKAGQSRSVTEFEDIMGEYSLNYYGYLSNNTGEKTLKLKIIENEASMTPKVYIQGFVGNYVIEGEYNEETGVISIEDEQYIAYMEDAEEVMVFRHKQWVRVLDEEGNETTAMDYANSPLEIIVNGDELTFGDYDIVSFEVSIGYYFLGGQMSATKIPPTEWARLEGKALLADGWILPAMSLPEGETHVSLAYEVDVDVATNKPNLLRIVDPFKNNKYVSAYNYDEDAAGYINIDYNDHECVLVEAGVYSGLEMEDEEGFMQYYCNNLSGYLNYYGWDTETIKAYALGDMDENGGGSYRFDLSTYDPELKLITINDAGYGIKGGSYDDSIMCYNWVDGEGNVPDMTCYLDLSSTNLAGVNDIVVDSSENAPVVYYNLQGVRVANPSNGLYLRVQGNKVVKVIVK